MKMGDFPCGGGTTPSSKRTEWPLAGGPIQVKMEHDRVATAVYLGLGDNPKAFNTTLVPQEIQQGIGDFCYANVVCLLHSYFRTLLSLGLGFGGKFGGRFENLDANSQTRPSQPHSTSKKATSQRSKS